MNDDASAILSIEDCQRLTAPLRHDLEIFDYEVRRLLVRIGADARQSGAEEARFLAAATTILLSIAAETTARAAMQNRSSFSARAFVDGAQNAAQWAMTRNIAFFVAGEA